MQLCIKKVNDWNFGKYWRVNFAWEFRPRRVKKREKRPVRRFGIHRYLNGSGWALAPTDLTDRPSCASAKEYYSIAKPSEEAGRILTRAGGLLSKPTRSDSIGILCSVIEGCFCIGTALPDGVGPCVRAAPQSAAAGENRPSFCWASACLLPACLPRRPAFFSLKQLLSGFY